MSPRGNLPAVVVTLLAAINLGAGGQRDPFPDSPDQKKVFTLYIARRDAPATISADAAFRDVLTGAFGAGVDYYAEYMDIYRFGDSRYRAQFRDYLRDRYAGVRFDAVVAPTSTALQILRNGNDRLFASSPLIFHSGKGESAGPMTTGLVSEIDLTRSLDLALALHPDTTRIVLVSGASAIDREYAAWVRSAFRPYDGRLTFNDLEGRSMAELRHTLAHLPADSFIYYVMISEDGAGQRFLPTVALDELALVANVPLYSWHEKTFGLGTVGGWLYSDDIAMRKLGELTVRVLKGEAPEKIPISEIEPYVLQFDDRQLRRWGISARRLPLGSVVLFKAPDVLTRFRPYVIGGGLVVSVGGVFVLLWTAERRRRMIATRETESQFVALAHLERRASLGELTASITHELGQPIATILRNADAARMILASSQPKLDTLRDIVDDIQKSDRRAHQLIQRLRTLLRKHEVRLDSVDLNQVVESATGLAAPLAAERGVILEICQEREPCIVPGDAIHLEQAVLNLVLNGIDAMGETPPGSRHVTVSVSASGDHIAIAVRDQGHGFMHDALGRAFEPFFSTKPNGMGMGLSIVRNIVQGHGGSVIAANHDNGGAVVTIVLPYRAKEKADQYGAGTG